MRYRMIRLALEAISVLGLDSAFAPRTRGAGVILTFHRVHPDNGSILPENAGLSITPAFLDQVLTLLRALEYEIIPLGIAPHRLAEPSGGRPFAVLTFDDGYRDNRDFALPILRKHNAPFTLFACSGFAERTTPLWWLDLEDAVRQLDGFRLALPDGVIEARTQTLAEKITALRQLYWRLRAFDEETLRAAVTTLAHQAGLDPLARVAALCMDWQELRAFATDPLVTIGAHTLTHPRLTKLDAGGARAEIAGSRDRIREELGLETKAFAYPVGDLTSAGPREFEMVRDLGFEVAVTTVPGVLKLGQMMTALPRISVNGLFQKEHYLRALISGLPFWRP